MISGTVIDTESSRLEMANEVKCQRCGEPRSIGHALCKGCEIVRLHAEVDLLRDLQLAKEKTVEGLKKELEAAAISLDTAVKERDDAIGKASSVDCSRRAIDDLRQKLKDSCTEIERLRASVVKKRRAHIANQEQIARERDEARAEVERLTKEPYKLRAGVMCSECGVPLMPSTDADCPRGPLTEEQARAVLTWMEHVDRVDDEDTGVSYKITLPHKLFYALRAHLLVTVIALAEEEEK